MTRFPDTRTSSPPNTRDLNGTSTRMSLIIRPGVNHLHPRSSFQGARLASGVLLAHHLQNNACQKATPSNL